MCFAPWSRKNRLGFALVCTAGLAISALTFGPALRLTLQGVTDFLALYAGGKIAFSGDIYNAGQILRTEIGSGGWSSSTRLFIRLPFVATLLWPLAQLPYSAASAIWEILCIGAFTGFALLWPNQRRWAVTLACCWSLPAFMTVAEGQDIGFLLLWIALAAVLLGRNRPGAAGLVASLCAAKFHLFVLVPLWILAKRKWRFARGLVAGGGLLLGLSFTAGGLDWLVRYYRFLRDPANNYSPATEVMPNLHGLFANVSHGHVFEIAGLAVIAAAVWMAARHTNPGYGMAAALAGGVLAAPHVYMADCALLIPGSLAVLSNARSRWTRAWAMLLLLPVPYLLLMVGIGWPVRLGLVVFVLTLAWEGWRQGWARCSEPEPRQDRACLPILQV
jgi:hypothetical protein